MEKFIARTTGVGNCYFINKHYKVTDNNEEAAQFITIGDCMRACIELNKQFGAAVFSVHSATSENIE